MGECENCFLWKGGMSEFCCADCSKVDEESHWFSVTAEQNSLPKQVGRLLYTIGFEPNLKGFHFIAVALELISEDDERLRLITKLLYPEVAKRCHTSASCVERDMRFSIRKLWEQYPERLYQMGCGKKDSAPTIKQFLSSMALYLFIKGSAA